MLYCTYFHDYDFAREGLIKKGRRRFSDVRENLCESTPKQGPGNETVRRRSDLADFLS